MRLPLRLTPSTVVSLLALFFALGGSALAIGTKISPQPRCAQGAVRGLATVVGEPLKGIANMPDQFTSNDAFFARKFNCTGGPIQVRRVNAGLFEITFAGNPAPSAIATAIADDGSSAAVNRLPNGTFRVSTRSGTADANQFVLHDTPFLIVLL